MQRCSAPPTYDVIVERRRAVNKPISDENVKCQHVIFLQVWLDISADFSSFWWFLSLYYGCYMSWETTKELRKVMMEWKHRKDYSFYKFINTRTPSPAILFAGKMANLFMF